MFVDIETGELTLAPKDKTEYKKVTVKHYIGVDVPFIAQSESKKELLKSVKCLDGHLNNKVYIDRAYLLDCVITGIATPKMIESIEWFRKKMVAWNYAFVTKEEIIKGGLTTAKHYARWIKDMEPFLRVEKIKNSDDLRVRTNPVILWKGDLSVKDMAIEAWYGVKLPKFGENQQEESA